MSHQSEFQNKLITPEQAGNLVKSGDTVDLYGYNACGELMDRELARRVNELRDVKVRCMQRVGVWKYLQADSECRSFISTPIFVGPIERIMIKHENMNPHPALFYEYPLMYRKGDLRVDVGSRMVSPMDEEGYFHFGNCPAYGKGLVDGSKVFVAEINTNMHPVASAHPDCKIHISEVDYIVEGENPAFGELPDPIPTEIDEKIAGYIYSAIGDGACLQIGYGNTPFAVTSLLAKSDLKDLGVHTEMLTDSIMKLYQAGLVTGKKKQIDKGQMTYCLGVGTRAFVDFIYTCTDAHSCPVDYTNDPHIIGLNDNVVSINGCLEMDITGQINSETMGTRQISGTGGQLDFVLGAYRSKNGQSIIACPATYKKKDGTIGSRIVTSLNPGTGISDPRASVHKVVTEYGMVTLKGATLWERAERMISIAHPDFREQLFREAENLKLWRRSNKI